MTQNAGQLLTLAQAEPGDQELKLAIVETGRDQLATMQQHLRLTMDAMHGMVKFSVYLEDRFTDFVRLVDRHFLYPGTLSAEQVRRIAQRKELLGRRLDEIELITAVKISI